MSLLSLGCLGLLVAGCSTISPGAGTVNGTVAGTHIQVGDAISATRTMSSYGADGFILMTSTADACGDVSGGVSRRNSHNMIISISDVDSSGTHAPTGGGTYT